jgi:hypothetical protein
VGTAFVGTAFVGTAFVDTAFVGTAFVGTAFVGTAFKPTFWEIYAQLATPNRRAALQSSAARCGSRSAPRFPIWNG